MILYTDIILNTEPGYGDFRMLGHGSLEDAPGNNGSIEFLFTLEVLQGQAIQYGIDPNDIQSVFKSWFREILSLSNPEHAEVTFSSPYEGTLEEVQAKRAEYNAYVLSVQAAKIAANEVEVLVDRTDLCNKLIALLPAEGLAGRFLEEQKLLMHSIRDITTEREVLEAQEAVKLFEMKATDYAEPALVAGAYIVETLLAT
jgi:hypothetical protein